jgi:hypothetical protein
LTWPEEMSQLAKNKTLRKETGLGKKKKIILSEYFIPKITKI